MAKITSADVKSNSNKSARPKSAKVTAKKREPAKRKRALDPNPCDECNPCNGLEPTGTTGLVYCDGAGSLRVLPFSGGNKVLGWDSNGPYWREPDTTPGGA